MTECIHIGNATLYCGDCREVLPALDWVDAIVTDPPYGTKVTDWDDSVEAEVIATLLTKTDGYATFFYSNTRLWHILPIIKSSGRDAWIAVWHKANAMGFERRFAPQWTPIVIAYSGTFPFWGQDLCACPIVPHRGLLHPTPKPVGITSWCVQNASDKGDVVFDPWMGSGTTGVSCAQLGRAFVGVEINPRYFDIACRRIEEAQRQGDMLNQLPPAEDPADARMADLFAEPEE